MQEPHVNQIKALYKEVCKARTKIHLPGVNKSLLKEIVRIMLIYSIPFLNDLDALMVMTANIQTSSVSTLDLIGAKLLNKQYCKNYKLLQFSSGILTFDQEKVPEVAVVGEHRWRG